MCKGYLLVIDDNPALVEGIAADGRALGWAVDPQRTSQGGTEALVRWERQDHGRPNVLMLDLMIPLREEDLEPLDKLRKERVELMAQSLERGLNRGDTSAVDKVAERVIGIDAEVAQLVKYDAGVKFLEKHRETFESDWHVVVFTARDISASTFELPGLIALRKPVFPDVLIDILVGQER